jgi:uncharacterized protein (TIGR02284 family)
MLLRNELQVALQDAEVACVEVADGHDAAAEILADDPLAATLRELAQARRAAAAQLGDHLRQLGDLPRAPDTDLETFRELAARLKAALAADHRRVLLDERSAAEAHLADTAEVALAQAELSPETRALVEETRAASRAAADRLTALRTDP